MQHHRHDLAELDHNPLVPKGLHLAAQVLSQRSSSQVVAEAMWLAAAQLDRTIFPGLLAHQLSDRLLQLRISSDTVTSLELKSAQKGFEIEDLTRQKAERETHIDVLEARVSDTREELEVSQLFAAERVRELEKTQHDFDAPLAPKSCPKHTTILSAQPKPLNTNSYKTKTSPRTSPMRWQTRLHLRSI